MKNRCNSKRNNRFHLMHRLKRRKQYGGHFADDIFKSIFLNEDHHILI